MYPDWTKRGLIWVSSDELIQEWERRKVAVNVGARIKLPWKWRRHRPDYNPYNWQLKKRTDTETLAVPNKGENPLATREAAPADAKFIENDTQPAKCTCGTATPCTAH